MGNILKRLSVTSVAAVAICAATVTDASAASGNGACSMTGVKGGMTFTNWTSSYVDISGYVSDTSADGHHVGIRFRSIDDAYVTDWSWHQLQRIWVDYQLRYLCIDLPRSPRLHRCAGGGQGRKHDRPRCTFWA